VTTRKTEIPPELGTTDQPQNMLSRGGLQLLLAQLKDQRSIVSVPTKLSQNALEVDDALTGRQVRIVNPIFVMKMDVDDGLPKLLYSLKESIPFRTYQSVSDGQSNNRTWWE
jgi:hypothetical protein